MLDSLQSFFSSLLPFLADNPAMRQLQFFMLIIGAIIIFLVFFTTRDMLLRSNSLVYMLLCILLVAFVPVIGFLIYLLIRPARTLKQREMETMLKQLLTNRSVKPAAADAEKSVKTKEGKKKKKSKE